MRKRGIATSEVTIGNLRIVKSLKYLGISIGVCSLSVLTLNFEYLGKSYSRSTLPLIESRQNQKSVSNTTQLSTENLTFLKKESIQFLIISEVFENSQSAKNSIKKLHTSGFRQASYYKKSVNEHLVCLQDTYSKESAIMLKHKLESQGQCNLTIYKIKG